MRTFVEYLNLIKLAALVGFWLSALYILYIMMPFMIPILIGWFGFRVYRITRNIRALQNGTHEYYKRFC